MFTFHCRIIMMLLVDEKDYNMFQLPMILMDNIWCTRHCRGFKQYQPVTSVTLLTLSQYLIIPMQPTTASRQHQPAPLLVVYPCSLKGSANNNKVYLGGRGMHEEIKRETLKIKLTCGINTRYTISDPGTFLLSAGHQYICHQSQALHTGTLLIA